MKILLVSTYSQRCGIAEYCRQLKHALNALGHKTYVLAEVLPHNQAPVQEEDGVYRSWQRGRPYTAPHGAEAIVQAVKSSATPPDIVHIQHEFGLFQNNSDFHQLTLDLRHAIKGRKLPVVTTLHTVLTPPFQSSFFREPIIDAIVHTSAQATVFCAWPEQLSPFVIPHGCPDLSTTVTDGTYDFLCPGFISPSKDHKGTLLAFASTAAPTRMLITGQCNSDLYMTELEHLVHELGLEDRVVIKAAYQESPTAFFDKTRCIILGGARSLDKPPPYSASGQLAAANGFGVPVIARNLPIYQDGVALHYNTIEELTLHMNSYHAAESTLVAEGCRLAQTRTWTKVAERHVEAYKTLIG